MAPAGPASIVIVGAGAAGVTAATTLRAEGYDGSITMVGAESCSPYRRPAVSKDLLAGTRTIDGVGFGTVPSDVRHRSGVRVVDIADSAVRLDSGETLTFDAALLATGSRARTLDHLDADCVFVLREFADVEPLRTEIDRTDSVLVIGAGLIGCEAAATARELGARVTVVDFADRPLSRMAPPPVSDMIRDLHAEHGVDMHMGVSVTSVRRQHDGTLLATAADGRTWTAGTVLVAVGSVADTDLARAAGLEVDDGIVVDEHLRTSVEGIWAAGDVARVPDRLAGGTYRSEHWNGAVDQGAAAARSMLGLGAPPLDVPWGWTTQYGVTMQFAGRGVDGSDIRIDGSVEERSFIAYAIDSGTVVGAVGVGRPKDVRAARALIAERSVLAP